MTNLESLDLDAVTGGTLSPTSSAPFSLPSDIRLPGPPPSKIPAPAPAPTVPLGPFTPPSTKDYLV